MEQEMNISLFDMVMALSDAMDLVSRDVVDHHKKVSYISYCIATEMGLPESEKENIMLAGALHDMGAFSLEERIGALNFELVQPHSHAEAGYQILKKFAPFGEISNLIRFHHVPWDQGEGTNFNGKIVPMGSHIIHLSDRISVLLNGKKEALGQVDTIRNKIENHRGTLFVPEIVDAFHSLADKSFFWFDISSPMLSGLIERKVRRNPVQLNLQQLARLASVFRQMIDFRCSFTANHSTGVAASAAELAKLFQFSDKDCFTMRIAGYLHDLGKLAVAPEILQKPGKLNAHERNIIKSHTYFTHRILERIHGLETINGWASLHHERLDGKGYPFGKKASELSLGSRVMAVADVFTAIKEDRPYRKGMDKAESLRLLKKLADNQALDLEVVHKLTKNYSIVNSVRELDQSMSVKEYQEFLQGTS